MYCIRSSDVHIFLQGIKNVLTVSIVCHVTTAGKVSWVVEVIWAMQTLNLLKAIQILPHPGHE